jgi:isopentenyldiphosphate isomerase
VSEELVDVVDHDDRVIATVTRAEMRARNLRHRSVGIAVFGSDGRLLVHRRADTKDVWPGMWDLAAGGVVAAGEGYEAAAHRELAEELGIVCGELVPVGEFRYHDAAVSVVGHCYAARHDGPFTFTDGEIAEVRWVTAPELDSMVAAERFVPDSLAAFTPLTRIFSLFAV